MWGRFRHIENLLSFYFVSITAMEEDCLHHSWLSRLLLSLKKIITDFHFLDDLKQTNSFFLPHEHIKAHHNKFLDNIANGKHFPCSAMVTRRQFMWDLCCIKCWDRKAGTTVYTVRTALRSAVLIVTS